MCEHKNLIWQDVKDSQGRDNVTICTDCDEVVAAMNVVTNG